ncbi:MAG: alpha/beta hydrolase [Pseudomonadota bacterium]
MSPEARAFLDASGPLPPPPASRAGLQQMREGTLEGFRPAAESVRDQCVDEIRETELGGVRTWQVHPKTRAGREPGFTILYFYGGGFIQGSPFEDLPIIGRIAEETGAIVHAPWYRLSPEHPFPAAHEDALAAYRAICDSADGGPFAVMGESAGGNLALATVLNARASELQLPASMALLSPWSDLTEGPDSIVTNDGHDPTLNASYLRFAADAYRGGRDTSDPLISPVFAECGSDMPPTIITTGTRDLLLSHSICQARALEKAGADVTLRVWDGMWHVFEFYPDLPEAQCSLSEVAAHLLGTATRR